MWVIFLKRYFISICFDVMEIANPFSDLHAHSHVSVSHGVAVSSKVLLVVTAIIGLSTLTTWNVFGGHLVQLCMMIAVV